MNRIFTILIFASMILSELNGQLQSPERFFPHLWGNAFTPHHLLVDYFKHAEANSDWVMIQEYGRTNENRPLLLAFVSTPENLEQLEQIRLNHLSQTGANNQETNHDLDRAIVWISCSVHGNEAAGSESSPAILHELITPDNERTKEWLKNTIVVIDPSINPDGYARYTNWYREVAGQQPDPRPDSREHLEPWPGGRTNHYYFDLNRDWAWQTQIESQQRMVQYNQWLPHIHVDLHEQGYNSPYYFAPAAQPYHDYITQWQRDFQVSIGKNHAKYFDRNGWFYFTKEVFDLLYPSYGDTYPTYLGSIGMTYEQGGSGRAGRAIKLENGDTLTLMDRILHHKTTSLSTIEMGSQNSTQLIQAFKSFYDRSRQNPPGKFKSFIIRGTNNFYKIRAFCEILDKNKIQYGRLNKAITVNAYDYLNSTQ